MKQLPAWLALAAVGVLLMVTPAMGQLLGQNLFPSNSPWNQDISGAPVATNSASIISAISAIENPTKLHPDWGDDNPTNGTMPLYGIPYNVVHGNSTTKTSVVIDDYASESDIVPAPIPTNAVIEGDYQDGPNTNGPGYNTGQRGDSHLLVWDEDNNVGYEFYGAARPSDTNTIDETPHTDGKWHAAQETVWNYKTNDFRPLGYTSADAAGLSILAGLARPDEGLPASQGGQGAINHALRMTLPGTIVGKQYIYPASHIVSESGTLPMGSRFRLQNNSTVNALIATMGPESQIVAHAMQHYGLILADVGSAMFVTGASSAVNSTNGISLVWNMDDILDGLEQLKASNFDLVTLAPAVTNLSQSSGAAGTSLTIQGYNFSGAAGHLSVFFGTNSASTPNVFSDSQISVVVPSGTGTGTVTVTVQSGLYEPDTYDSPGANVNAPIFGYGISATNASDEFTYVAVPRFLRVFASGGNFIASGTNNGNPSGTYNVLASTNLLLPLTNWTVLSSGSFGSNGNFSFTNAIASTNREMFYLLRVP
ncbi:MAG TPA: IPT/TIG domain-containing protein [Candidatus Sulfotelmatobacter sp.]|nr:IPT/TIG domain-containing protein [Candidatus Sulfotelmatobacter sp.]